MKPLIEDIWAGCRIALLLLAVLLLICAVGSINDHGKMLEHHQAVLAELQVNYGRQLGDMPSDAGSVSYQLDAIRERITWPRFSLHRHGCRQCSDDRVDDEGPAPLCETGFRLLQADMQDKAALVEE
jgi:hypothetical protein